LSQKKPVFGYEIIKFLIQEECGESKTPHLQGVIQFKNQVDFNMVKSYLPDAHWEKSRSIVASFKYCGKLDTRSGDIFSYGDVSKYIEIEPESESEFLDNLRLEMTGYQANEKIPYENPFPLF